VVFEIGKNMYQHILIRFKHPSIHVPSIDCLWMVKISMYLKARKFFYYPMNTCETLLFGQRTYTKIHFSSYIYGSVK